LTRTADLVTSKKGSSVTDPTDLLIWADYTEEQGQDSAAIRALTLRLLGTHPSFALESRAPVFPDAWLAGEHRLAFGDGSDCDYGVGNGDGYGAGDGYSASPGDGWGDGGVGDGDGDGWGDGGNYGDGDGYGCGYGDLDGAGPGDGDYV
jgi:hypothetical protein